MSALAAAFRGLADQIVATGQPAQRIGYATGQVVDVTAGVITVAVLGDQVQAPYHGALPSVGAMVDLLIIDSSPVILGVLNGIPTF